MSLITYSGLKLRQDFEELDVFQLLSVYRIMESSYSTLIGVYHMSPTMRRAQMDMAQDVYRDAIAIWSELMDRVIPPGSSRTAIAKMPPRQYWAEQLDSVEM